MRTEFIRLEGVERQRFSTPLFSYRRRVPCPPVPGTVARTRTRDSIRVVGASVQSAGWIGMHVFYGEMSMSLLYRYAGGLACLVTMLALVACGAGPGSPKVDPVGFKNIDLKQGESIREISLVNTFSGSKLTYKATSDKPAVATVTVDNDKDTLTVTAVGPGTATITVTAKNSQGEAEQKFTVTVPKPPAADPDPVDIPDIPSLDEDATSTIPLGDKFSGENLTYAAESNDERVATVTVNNTADTLTVTAVGAGTATITVKATATAQGSTPQTKTFTVTVPEAASAETAPTVKTGATSTVSVAVGATSTVTLSTVFDGATSYAATSSAETMATATESGGTLTITGVSIGSATITIVATNDAGSVTHQIAVTVTAPVTTTPTTPTPTSSTLTIELGESAKRMLAAGQTLQEPPDKGVTVEPSPDGETGNVWVITAKRKGTHKVTILSAGKAVGTITVGVPNSRPVRLDETTEDGDLNNPRIDLSTATALSVPDAPPRIYYVILTSDGTSTGTPINDYFTDDDDGDSKRYRIENKPPWFLIETDENDFVKKVVVGGTDFNLGYQVLQKVEPSNEKAYEFTVSLYASDGEDESTRPVVIEFTVDDTALTIAPINYDVDQDVSGNFRDGNKDGSYNNRLEVGPRREVTHTVTFTGTGGTSSKSGFVFVENAYEDIPSEDRPTSNQITTAGDPSIFYKDGRNADKLVGGTDGDIPTGYQVPGTRYFLIRGSGAVVVEGGAADSITIGDSAKVSFSLKGGSSGSITIEYKVWLNKGVVDNSADTNSNNDENNTTSTKSTTKTLSINVLNCSSPPNPISDCP